MPLAKSQGNYLWDELQIDQSIDLDLSRDDKYLADHIFPTSDPSQILPNISRLNKTYLETVTAAIHTCFPGPGSCIRQLSLECTSTDNSLPHSLRLTVTEKSPPCTIKLFASLIDNNNNVLCDGFAIVTTPDHKLGEAQALESIGRRHQNYKLFLGRVKQEKPITTAVVFPCDDMSLQACREAVDEELILPLLIGPESKIRAVATRLQWDISPYKLYHCDHAQAASSLAMDLVNRREASMVMKGSLHTDDLLREVVKPQTGLRTGRRISHVFVIDVPGMERPLFITDAAINIAPDLKTKVDITQNAIDLARILGIDSPKVAILSAIETVNPDLPSSVDAALLAKMAERHQITGATVDGPLAMDNAINLQAAQTKGIQSAVAGNADILIVPNIEAGNMLVKELTFLGNADCAGIVVGAKVPIVLTSRADNVISRLASCAVAVLMHQHQQSQE